MIRPLPMFVAPYGYNQTIRQQQSALDDLFHIHCIMCEVDATERSQDRRALMLHIESAVHAVARSAAPFQTLGVLEHRKHAAAIALLGSTGSIDLSVAILQQVFPTDIAGSADGSSAWDRLLQALDTATRKEPFPLRDLDYLDL
jgi:hypothetical protein